MAKTRCCTNDEPTKTAAQMRNESARRGNHLAEALQEYRTAKEINSQINEDMVNCTESSSRALHPEEAATWSTKEARYHGQFESH